MTDRSYLSIVSGLPRSGTSMMMQMIDKGGLPALVDDIRTADDDNPKGYYEFEPVKKTKDDASWIEGGIGKVVKMVHLLLLDLPLDYRYRVVFMRRNLEEVVQSQNIMLERHGKDTGGLPVDRLQNVFRAQIHKVIEHMRAHSDHFKFIEVDYNEVLQDPRPHMEKVSAFLDGLAVDAMHAIIDPSLYRNRAKE